MKSLTAAVVAGVAIERSLATADQGCAVHNAVAHEAQIEQPERIRQYWTPTGDMLDMFSKKHRLTIAEPFIDVPTVAAWAKAKSADLTTGVLAVLTRAGGRGLAWVHPLLRFASAGQTQRADDREAAE